MSFEKLETCIDPECVHLGKRGVRTSAFRIPPLPSVVRKQENVLSLKVETQCFDAPTTQYISWHQVADVDVAETKIVRLCRANVATVVHAQHVLRHAQLCG